MKLYSYSPTTGEYIGDTTADPSPLEAGKFLYPANTTETPPPLHGTEEAAVYNGQSWHVVEDHRGAKGWLDGKEHEVKELGALPDGWSDTPPEIETRVAELRERLGG